MRALAAAALLGLAGQPAFASPAPAPVRQVQAAYRAVLMEEVCARHVAGDGDTRLRVEARRLRNVLRNAQRHGLGDALLRTKREWDYFQTVADWVCGRGAGVAALRTAIDHLERSVDTAIRARGKR